MQCDFRRLTGLWELTYQAECRSRKIHCCRNEKRAKSLVRTSTRNRESDAKGHLPAVLTLRAFGCTACDVSCKDAKSFRSIADILISSSTSYLSRHTVSSRITGFVRSNTSRDYLEALTVLLAVLLSAELSN